MSRAVLVLLALVATALPARGGGWLSYQRSGGITGWSLKAAVDSTGSVRVEGTRQDAAASLRAPLSAAEQAELRHLLDRVLAGPPRVPQGDLRHLADGMRRLVVVEDAGGRRVLDLSDGMRTGPDDRALVAALEALARRTPAEASPAAMDPPEREAPPAPAHEPERPLLDVVVVGSGEGSDDAGTALLLELPVGRAHEPEGARGALELLLLVVLGPQAEVLLSDGPPVHDPDTGAWSLVVTPARTRLLVTLDAAGSPAAARGALARLRTLVARSEDALRSLAPGELDHHRRRLAATLHARRADPRTARAAALRGTAWGPGGDAPAAWSVSAVRSAELVALARRLRAGHARLLLSGPLARRAASQVGRGFRVAPRGPLSAEAPSARGKVAAATRGEAALSAPAAGAAVGPAAALALDLAGRRHSASWAERVEPGELRLAVPGDTLALVAPQGALDGPATEARLRNTLERLALGLQQSALDVRLRRRPLGYSATKAPDARVREAADLLELGAVHPGAAELSLAGARARLERVDAAQVRAACAALAESLRALAPAAAPSATSARPEEPLLRAASEALFGPLETGAWRGARLERRGSGPDGQAELLQLELTAALPLRLRGAGDPVQASVARLSAGDSPAARREQGLVARALADPSILLAGAEAGLFPVRRARDETLAVDGTARRCGVVEVLVPARGLYRLLVDRDSSDVRAVDRRDELGRTERVLMSDIRQDAEGRRRAARHVLLRPDGGRELLLESPAIELRPR